MSNQLNSNYNESPLKYDEKNNDQNLSHSDNEMKKSKRIKSDFPFGKCKVCNDEATGIHYGVGK